MVIDGKRNLLLIKYKNFYESLLQIKEIKQTYKELTDSINQAYSLGYSTMKISGFTGIQDSVIIEIIKGTEQGILEESLVSYKYLLEANVLAMRLKQKILYAVYDLELMPEEINRACAVHMQIIKSWLA